MAVTNHVMNAFAGSDIDKAYLVQNEGKIAQKGQTPAEAIAIFHRTKMYHDALYEALTPLHTGVTQEGNAAMRGQVVALVRQYVERWLASQQGGQ
jgi:hypothetical protein